MIYLDTGCLVKLYYPEEDSEVIAIKTAGLQIVFTPLHNLELTSAMRLKVFRQEATEDQVLAVLQFVRDDLASGGWWRVACGLWLVACGLWLVACGLWLVACGLWLVACGLWLVEKKSSKNCLCGRNFGL
jgi:hypothetical protein